MTIEPRDDREFSAKVEVAAPAWLPVSGRLEVSGSRIWSRRADFFTHKAIKNLGLSEEEFFARLEVADSFADVFKQATTQALHTGDEEYSDLLAQLVAAALDKARIDTVSYLLTRINGLEPVHIRILLCCEAY